MPIPHRRGRLLRLTLFLLVALEAPAAATIPLFRFIHLTDGHVTDDLGDRYREANKKLRSVIDNVTNARWAPRPDFVLSTGDMAHASVPQLLEQDNELAAKMLRGFGLPVMATAGNHEVFQGEGDDFREAPYLRHFGNDMLTYAVFYRGVLFVMVNNSGGLAGGEPISDQRNAQVARLLERYPDAPKIIACHIPLVSVRDPEVLRKSAGFSTFKVVGEGGLLPIIERHRETVIAVISGHLHLTGHVVVNDIHHIVASGTASYPNHYGEYAVWSDRITVTVRQPDSKLLKRFDGLVHDRTGIAYTDAAHPSHEEYVSGLPGEREFEIKLTGRKAIQDSASLLALNPQGWVAPFGQVEAQGAIVSQVTNLSEQERLFCVTFREAGRRPLVVSSVDGSKMFLSPLGQRKWTPDELQRGVPVLVPAGGSVQIQGSDRNPPGFPTLVDTRSLILQDKATLEARVRVRKGMRFWTDRAHVVDEVPDELIGLERMMIRCHQREVVVRRKVPGKVYAVFLPVNGVMPGGSEIEGCGWKLYREKAFNGTPYPRNQTQQSYDIYVQDLVAGENRLVEPRPEPSSTWAIVGIADAR